MTMASVRAENTGDLGLQVVQRVAMLGKEDDLPLPSGFIVHLRSVLQKLREFLPLAVLS